MKPILGTFFLLLELYNADLYPNYLKFSNTLTKDVENMLVPHFKRNL